MDNCRFKFLREPPGGPNRRFCDACGRDVRGFVYHDKCKNYDLHPCCMNLESTMSAPGGMKLILMDKAPYKCVKCERKDLKVQSKEPFRGWSYVFMETKVQSKADSCGNYCYHVYCVKKLILDKWEGGYFNGASSSSRERRLVRGETASSTRSLTTSATSKALARRGSSRPPTSLLTRGFKILKIGFSVLISVLFGNPTPLFPVLLETLLD